MNELVTELQKLQRIRAWYMKSRIMVSNRLQATVAGELGFSSGMKENERKKVFKEAGILIKQVLRDEASCESDGFIHTTNIAIEGFSDKMALQEKTMLIVAEKLPVYDWTKLDDQKGFGTLSLATVVGETGDFCNYDRPGKVWKRLGCAPFEKDGIMLMGATWKSRSRQPVVKLSSIDWTEYGYSPRRRSIAWILGENLIKQNAPGPYRRRYDSSRARLLEKNPDYSKGRCHNHGRLLAAKLLLKNLWMEWNKLEGTYVESGYEHEMAQMV